MDWLGLALAIISSGALTATVTAILSRKKLHADAMSVSVETALKLEERATLRYDSAVDALNAAQFALDAARIQIRSLEDYIEILHDLLDIAGIRYPGKPKVEGVGSDLAEPSAENKE